MYYTKILLPVLLTLPLLLGWGACAAGRKSLLSTGEEKASAAEPAKEQPLPREPFTISITGDIVFPEETAGRKDFFSLVRKELRADWLMGNLEGPITDHPERRVRPNRRSVFAFRFQPETAPALLAEAGFNLIFLANNHTWDYGEQGLHDTVSHLARAGIRSVGLTNDITVVTQAGHKIAFVGFYFGPRFHNMHDTNRAVRLVTEARSRADTVLVILHAGAEGPKALHVRDEEEKYFGIHRGNSVAFSRLAIDAGADAVIAFGPHVVRAVERYKGRYILYSLGNFLPVGGLKIDGVLRYAVIAELTLRPGRREIETVRLIPVVFRQDRLPRPDPEAGALRLMRSLTEDFYRDVAGRPQDVLITEEGFLRTVEENK